MDCCVYNLVLLVNNRGMAGFRYNFFEVVFLIIRWEESFVFFIGFLKWLSDVRVFGNDINSFIFLDGFGLDGKVE